MDYGLALKSDNGRLLFKHLFFLLRLNMALVQKNAYSRSIMMQLLNMLYQRHQNLPSWQMFMMSTAVFNEEVGEHSFSILSRIVLGDTIKCSFTHMNRLYALVNAYRANVDDMTSDQYRRVRPNKGYDLRKKTALKEAIEAFVHSLIRNVRANTYTVYTGPKKKTNPAYVGAAEALLHRAPSTVTTSMWERANVTTLTEQLSKMKTQATATYFGSWGQFNCSASWPEMVVDGAPVVAPLVEPDEDSEEPEEPAALSEEEAPGQPADDSDTPPEEEEASPYDSEEEEEKVPPAMKALRGRPSGRGGKGKGGRGKGGR